MTSSRWVSQRAVAWVYDDAPVPTALMPVLTVIAMRCDEHGRGSYQSAPTIAEKSGKSEDQVKRDIRELKKLGLLTPGDPGLVAHIEAWKRPAVYDVALHVKGPKPVKVPKNRAGVNSQGGGMDTPPGMDTPGGMDAGGRGCMDATPGGCMDTPQEKTLNNPMNNPPPPTPSSDTSALVVVDAEIVEVGEDSTSSTEDQLQPLIDEARQLRPGWSAVELRTHITAALGMLGGSVDAVAELVRRTAADPTSARPSRITASGNPYLRAASTAMTIARAEASPDPMFVANMHPDAHPFEANPQSRNECRRCLLPEPNARHRVPKSRNTRYDDWDAPAAPAAPGRHQTFRNPTYPGAYDGPL